MIPEAAVEAALNSYDPSWGLVPGDWDQHFKSRMRAALEAAAPHMLARAWNEGHDYHRGVTPDGLTGNPYRPTQ